MILPIQFLRNISDIKYWEGITFTESNRCLYTTGEFRIAVNSSLEVIREWAINNGCLIDTINPIIDKLYNIITTCPCEFPKDTTDEYYDEFDAKIYLAFVDLYDALIASLDNARKNIAGKVQFDLLPVEMLEEMARMYEFGNRKYEKDNWKKGFPYSTLYSAAMRHLTAFWKGENDDPESGMSHLTHAAWNMWTLLWLVRNDKGLDNRNNNSETNEENN